MSGKRGTEWENQTLSANDTNYALRMRLLNQAVRDAEARLREGHDPAAVIWELRDACRRAEQARPIHTYSGH